MKAMTLRITFMLAMLGFAITLAIVVGQRLSSEAMAVLLGVVAGVGASIPTSMIVVWLAARALIQEREIESAPPPRDEPVSAETPRVVVMQQPAPAQPVYGYPLPQMSPYPDWNRAAPYPAMSPPPTARKFTVIGGVSDLGETFPLQNLEGE